MTLGDLNIKSKENIMAMKRNLDHIEKAPLCNHDGSLTPEARAIFELWFDSFSKDGLMDPDDCVEFICSCTEDRCSKNDSRVTKLFDNYDSDGDGKVTKEEFV